MNIVCNPIFVTRKYPVKEDGKFCFAIMPFEGEMLQEVYTEYVKPVIAEAGIKCIRGDDIFSTSLIMEDIFGAICEANVVIAEFTGRNPNVLYEAGIAHTLGKSLIGITQDINDVPFDLRSVRHIVYKTTPNGLKQLKENLKNTLHSVMEQRQEVYPQKFEDKDEAYQRLLEAYIRKCRETDRMYSLIESRMIQKYSQYSEKVHRLLMPVQKKMKFMETGIGFVRVKDSSVNVDYFDEDKRRQVNIGREEVPEFYISETPITNRQYEIFVRETGHPCPDDWENGNVPAGRYDYPVIGVSWVDIVMFCRWLTEVTGIRIYIPSEAQWLAAAGYGNGRQIYPWGDAWIEGACNSKEYDRGKRQITEVGFFRENVSPCGCRDMLGNVWEWTDSPYDHEDENGFQWRAVRGGANYVNLKHIGVLARLVAHPGHFLFVRDLGFRVVTDGHNK